MKSIFREYDIRGIYEKDLTFDSVSKIGYFLGQRIKSLGDYVAIGYDARSHSPVLFKWLSSGFNAAGIKVLNMGLVPTPVNYFANFTENNSGHTPIASVMITGSHNPPEYNGFKITVDKQPFYGEQIYSMGREIMESGDSLTIEENDLAIEIDSLNRYIDYMVKEFEHLQGMKDIIIDCGNGVAGVALVPIFKKLGIDYEGMYTDPDGTFPNHHPDPSEEENLEDIKKALNTKGGFGFAYDGDADRIAALTPKNYFKGDVMALIFAREIHKSIDKPIIIGEVKCSQVMYDEINRFGQAIMWKTGHSNLKVKIKETGAHLASEVSGHMFFNDRYFGYDDAIYATLRIMELIKEGIDLDAEMAKLPEVYSTDELKTKTTEEKKFRIIEKMAELLKNPAEDFPAIKEIITVDGLRVIFEEGWGLVRASNTTPMLVTRFEATTPEKMKLYETKMTALIQQAESSI